MKRFIVAGAVVDLYWDGSVVIKTKDETLRKYVNNYLHEEGFFESIFLNSLA